MPEPTVDHLVLHSGVPGRVGTAVARCVTARADALGKHGVVVGDVSVRGKRSDPNRHLALKPLDATVRRAEHLWISSASLLGTRRMGADDHQKFRPEAEHRIADVVRQVQPRRTSIVIQSVDPAVALQLVYERAVRDGEHRPVDEVFALDHPWVDLVDLRRRLARIETVTDVEILPVELKQPPDPGAVFRAAKIGLPRGFAWDGDDTPDVRARVRATVGRLPGAIQRRLPSAVRPRPQVARPAKPIARSLDGLKWNRRALDACRSVNGVIADDDVRSDVHQFIRDLLAPDRPTAEVVWTEPERQRIASAHAGRDCGLFGRS